MSRRELIATLIVAAIAFPLIFVFTGAVIDARARAREAPFRAVLGNGRFEELMQGRQVTVQKFMTMTFPRCFERVHSPPSSVGSVKSGARRDAPR